MAFFPISPVPQSDGNFLLSMQTYVFSWVALTPTKVLVAYCQDNPIQLYVQIVNFNGSSAPTMGIATFVANLLGATANLPGVVVKLAAFDSSTVGLMWNPTTADPGNYNVSVLNIDGSDNITWNTPATFSGNNSGYSTNRYSFRAIDATNATITGYNTASSGSVIPQKVTRTGNSLVIAAQTGITGTGLVGTYSRKLPTAGIAHFYCSSAGANPNLFFTNTLSAVTAVTGVSGGYSGTPVISVSSNTLLHYFRSAAGVVYARPLNLNLGAGTGNWITTEQNYNITSWPAGTLLDVVQIDSEYFMVMGSPQVMADPTTYTPVTYSFVVGRYLSSNSSYVFAPIQTPVTAQGLPMFGMKHLHLVDANNIACFMIQGTTTNRVFGVKLLHL